ncbi:MAG: hypothetical protein RL641_574 [Candidatus Parcubacteria bacterium]|jgi:hypothetical protein
MKKIFYTLACAILIAQVLYAQPWQGLPGGSLNDRATAIISYGGYLWVGGIFTNAGPIITQSIVRHDGNQWISTPGLPSAPFAFCEYNNELYAFGGFNVAGLRYGIMKWTGVAWQPMAQLDYWGMLSTATVYNGELVTGGYFYSVDGIPAQSLIRWNGTNWQTFVGQITCFWLWPPRVMGLHVANGWLYVAGAFDQIGGTNTSCAAKWNGTNWVQLTIGWNTYASNFADSAGSVFVVGIFPYAGAATTSHGVAREGPSGWVNAGNGLQMNGLEAVTYHNKVYVGGSVAVATGTYVGNCGYWNGATWVQDNAGIAGGFIDCFFYDQASDKLYCGGDFNVAGGDLFDHIAYKGSVNLPVELTSFDCSHVGENKDGNVGVSIGEKILTRWTTASEINASHFSLSVSKDAEIYEKIADIPAHGTTTEMSDYQVAYEPSTSGTYYFRLDEFDYDGVQSGSWDCATEITPDEALSYDPARQIIYCDGCGVTVQVYSLFGQLVEEKNLPISTDRYSPGTYYLVRKNDREPFRFVVE